MPATSFLWLNITHGQSKIGRIDVARQISIHEGVFEQFAAWVANNQIVVDENTYGANPLTATQSGFVVLVFFNSLQAAFYSFFGTSPNSEAIENARGRPAHAQHTSEDHCSSISFQSGSGVIWYVSVFQLIPLWIDRWLLKTCFLLFKSVFEKYYYI